MKKLKITIIGAGSTYTPELIDGIIQRRIELPITEIYLMDIDPIKLDIVGGLVRRMLQGSHMSATLFLTTDLEDAVAGAEYIICQIRVGRLEARIRDEKIPLKYDLIGQETTGAGGFMKALRTIPAMIQIANVMERLAPDAWLINFTNPSGLITEMLVNHCRVKAIGLCNVPINMKRDALKRVPDDMDAKMSIDYIGLNHLSWVTNIYLRGEGILQDQLSGDYKLFRPVNVPKVEFDTDLLREIQAIPSSYLTYYYYRDQSLEHLKKEPKTRGEVCKEIEAELLQLYQNPNLKEKPVILEKRGGHLYSEAAISLVSAIYNDKQEEHIVNVSNHQSLSFMGETDVVEIKCRVGKNGVKPMPFRNFENQHIIGMMQAVKSYEKLTVQAGLTGDYALALEALLNHPLVGDYRRAKGVLEEMLAANKEFLPQFYEHAKGR